MQHSKIFLLLGGNMGDRLAYINAAKNLIGQQIGAISHQSAIYETAAWGIEQQPAFLNQVVELNTHLRPQEVLANALAIELRLDRKRSVKWYERTIDIDLLFYEKQIIEEPQLSVPHPQIPFRRFTLVPLAEIASTFIHPVLQESIQSLLEKCPDQLAVNLWKPTD